MWVCTKLLTLISRENLYSLQQGMKAVRELNLSFKDWDEDSVNVKQRGYPEATTCRVCGIQSVWHRELSAHAQSDLWPLLKQNVITTGMSSPLCGTVVLSVLPALSCCPSAEVLERHQQQIIPAEPSTLCSWAGEQLIWSELKTQQCKGQS